MPFLSEFEKRGAQETKFTTCYMCACRCGVKVALENKPSCIRVMDVADGDFDLLAKYNSKYPGKLKQYRDNIRNYPFSVIQYRDADISVATEIFTRH